MRALSLFSGIGGLDLAAHAVGIETVAFCEIEPFAVQVLERRWPGVPIIDDVRKIRGCDWTVDVVHGGFPCQDLSVAGKQAGLEGERSGLWFEMLRVVSELRPAFVLAENVRGAVNLALDTVCSGLGDEGYEVWPFVIPASAFGAPHQRERLFVVGCRSDVAHAINERLQGSEWGCPLSEPEEAPYEPAPKCGEGYGSLWPTPSTMDNIERKGMRPSRAATGRKTGYLSESVTGQLNPLWVECLMGYPLGWTDVDCDEPEPWPGWPALMGESQYPYEPPRTVTGCPNRAKRLKCLGNAVVPAQAYPFFEAIAIMEEVIRCNTKSSTSKAGATRR